MQSMSVVPQGKSGIQSGWHAGGLSRGSVIPKTISLNDLPSRRIDNKKTQ